MNRLFFLFAFALTALLSSAASAKMPTFPLTALEPGLRGYGLTAGAGNRIERFAVEVLALQYDVGTSYPLVLVRASGPLIEEAGGIASGMSGSPVYLPRNGQDALLGAIGYTFPGGSAGLGLVTPIETMRRANPRAQNVATFGPPFSPHEAVPVRTPLLISGLGAKASKLLNPLLPGELRPMPLQTLGAARPDDSTYRLEPGSAVSVQLVRGDVTIAAIGTLTLEENGAFWAFGHPLLARGDASFALAPAYVTATVPNNSVPFKLADSGQRLLGTVTQDRPYAVSGLLGRAPDFIPVTLTLSGDAGSATRHFEVTRDARLEASLLAAATLQSLTELMEETGAGSADLAWEISLANGQTVNILEQVSSPEDVGLAAARLAGEPLQQLADNPFQAARITAVKMSLEYSAEARVAEVVEVIPERERLRPGTPLRLNIRLQPYRQGPEVRELQVTLPPAFRGRLRLNVRGGLTPPDPRASSLVPPLYSFAEFVTALEDHIQGSELVVETVIAEKTRLLRRLSLPYLVAGHESFVVTVSRGQNRAAPRTPETEPERLRPSVPPRSPLEPEPPLDPDPSAQLDPFPNP